MDQKPQQATEHEPTIQTNHPTESSDRNGINHANQKTCATIA
jgi:hypothetical protein